MTLTTTGSSFDTLLAVYTGSEVAALRVVGSNDDESNFVRTSRITVSVVSGTVYRIAVDGYEGAQGAIQLVGSFRSEVVLAAPTKVAAARDPQGRVAISWSAVSSAARYEITVYSGTTVYAAGIVTTVNARTSGSLPKSVSLLAKVRAINSVGTAGPWSLPVAVR